jgi:oxygen-independent coproporphyrinogen III oxidase
MLKEIELISTRADNDGVVSTIYFGGGTPSLLSSKEIGTLLTSIADHFIIEPDAEITLEANPDDISENILQEWKQTGVNRLSIGIQSFQEEDLRWMNRAHNSTQAMNSIYLAKAAGFKNFSIDLIYGSPLLTDDQWKKNVDTIIKAEVPHVSCYALTVEDQTALHRMILDKKSPSPDSEVQSKQFLQLMEWMEEADYEHYEISNFSKTGKRSRHNSSYWKNERYVGIGPSAHSFDGNSRRWNVSNNILYVQQVRAGVLPYQEELLTETQKLNEYIMISLRTVEGIDLQKVSQQFGEEKARKIHSDAKKFVSQGKIISSGDKIRLTKEGKLFADGIASDLFF